jgi:hypothetical protein
MRRTYISPEYHSNKVWGTYDSIENPNYFGSKMLEIEDFVLVDKDDIIWFDNSNSEQIDFSVESALPSNFYSAAQDKLINHRIYIDEGQTEFQRERNTKWIIDIDIKKIISNYIFATLKKYRTFEGIRKNMTLENDVNIYIKKYIESNVLNRYKLSAVNLYIEYRELRDTNKGLRFNPTWNPNVPRDSLIRDYLTNFGNNSIYIDGSNITLSFEQKPSTLFTFEYYFIPLFTKI